MLAALLGLAAAWVRSLAAESGFSQPTNNNIAETGDPNLKPGETRSFTAKNVTAGNYALVCNIAKHYGLGMRAPFTVT